MFKKILSFFIQGPVYSLGAIESPKDSRTINTVAVQAPVNLPNEYEAPISPVEYQTLPDCVAHAIKSVKEGYMIDGGNFVALADEDLYNQCKASDGIPDQPGTYPLVGVKLSVSSGICSRTVYLSGDKLAIEADRSKYKLGGFMTVSPLYEQVCQAIYQNKRITAAFSVDTNWFIGLITKVLQSIGRHYIVLNGFKIDSVLVKGKNSWGLQWVGNIAGWIDPNLKPGHLNIYWPDVKDTVSDIYAFTDSIPNPILDHVKSLNYHFNKGMICGDQSYNVMQLQKRLAQEGFWPESQPFTGFYGKVTSYHVFAFQMANKIISDGEESYYGQVCGPRTLRYLNGEVGLDLLHAQIQVESQGNDYAVGDLSLKDHAYGCLQIRQGVVDQVNGHLGTSYKSQDCLGNRELSIKIWTTYWTIFTDMVTDKDKAFSWNGGPGWKQYYGKTGHETYTANLDAYWSKVHAIMK